MPCFKIDKPQVWFADSGFALGFIFLSPPFLPIRFFCAIFSNLEQDFGHLSPKKSQVWGHFSQKMSSVFNPLNSGGLLYTH